MPVEREHGGVSREGRLEMRVLDQSRADHPKQVIDLVQSDNQQLFEGMNGGALPVAPRGFPCSCWGERERWRRRAVRGGEEATAGPDRLVRERGASPFRLREGRRELLLQAACSARLVFRVERRVRALLRLLFRRRGGGRRLPRFVYIGLSVCLGRRGALVLMALSLSLALPLSLRSSRRSEGLLVDLRALSG